MGERSIDWLIEQVRRLSFRVETLEGQLQDLQRARNYGSDFELVSEPPADPVPPAPSSSAVYNSLAREIPPVSAAALQLCGNLRGGRLTFTERAQRAWSAGYWARFTLANRINKPRPTTPIDLANTTYVVLQAEGITSPVRVERASDYRALLRDFEGPSISHGFASKAEAKVYCLGAGVPYPETLYQWS